MRILIERWLPWYNPSVERSRNRHTEAIRQRSIDVRVRSEQIIDDYELAEQQRVDVKP